MRLLSIAAALLLLVIAEPVLADTATANPSADTFVSSANPTLNYGSAGALSIAAPGLSKGEFRSFLRFDTSSIKSTFDSTYGVGNWTMQSLTIRLAAAPPNNALFNGNAAGPGGTNINTAGLFAASWISDDAWLEGNGLIGTANTISGAVTFNNLPDVSNAESLGTFNFSGGTSGTSTYTLALSAGVLADITAGGNLSLQLLSADSSIAYVFNSRNAGNQPLLSATAVPEPAGLMSILLGALAIRRRR